MPKKSLTQTISTNTKTGYDLKTISNNTTSSYQQLRDQLQQKLHVIQKNQQTTRSCPQYNTLKLNTLTNQLQLTLNYYFIVNSLMMLSTRYERYNNKTMNQINKAGISDYYTLSPYNPFVVMIPTFTNFIFGVTNAFSVSTPTLFPKALNQHHTWAEITGLLLLAGITFGFLAINEMINKSDAVYSTLYNNVINGTLTEGKSSYPQAGDPLGWACFVVLCLAQARVQYLQIGLIQALWCHLSCLDKHYDVIIDSATNLQAIPKKYREFRFTTQCPLFTQHQDKDNQPYKNTELQPHNTILVNIKGIGVYMLRENWIQYCITHIDDKQQVESPFVPNDRITVMLEQCQQLAQPIKNSTCPLSDKAIHDLDLIALTPDGYAYSARGDKDKNLLNRLRKSSSCPISGHELRHSQLTLLVKEQVKLISNNFICTEQEDAEIGLHHMNIGM
jgi:hypothetical protein